MPNERFDIDAILEESKNKSTIELWREAYANCQGDSVGDQITRASLEAIGYDMGFWKPVHPIEYTKQPYENPNDLTQGRNTHTKGFLISRDEEE